LASARGTRNRNVHRRSHLHRAAQLSRIRDAAGLSRDVAEIICKALA
jgi:hypothetical protein